jgi:hypothetical protein
MSGDVDVCAVAQQDPPVNAIEWAIVARDQQTIQSGLFAFAGSK